MSKISVLSAAVAIAATIVFTPSAQAAEIAAGKAKSAMCAACHGANGISNVPAYPNLAGQKQAYLKKQMKDFKNGKRKDPIMGAMVAALSDKDIANLAAYYASLKCR